MMRYFSAFSILFLLASLAQAQSSVRGKVTDPMGEPLPDVVVRVLEQEKGAQTNENGIYSFSRLNPGNCQLVFSYIGFKTQTQSVTLENDHPLILDIVLQEDIAETEEIVIEAQKMGEIDKKKVEIVNKITPQEIKLLPSLGTPDLAQYLQVIPGVVFTGDQGGQLFVRGGTPVQNLVLMDGAIVYNAFHTLGLFSVFDTDYIRKVDVYTGGFGAQYGGRLSSVMDIKTRNGNFNTVGAKLHVNPITSGVLIEGPIFKKAGEQLASVSYLLSARKCYLDQTSKSLYSYVNDTTGLPFSFVDLYGKITLGNGSNQLSLFGFHQQDQVSYAYPSSYKWRSTGGGAYFNFLPPNSSLILSGNFALSNYLNEQQSRDEIYPRKSQINGFNSRINFAYILNSINELAYGIQMLGFRTDLSFTNGLDGRTTQTVNNTEFAAYVLYKKVIRSRSLSPDGQATYKDRAVLEPSMRAHYYNEHGRVMFEPRLRAKFNFRKFSLQFATGVYSQNLIAATSDRDVVVLFQGFMTAPEDVANRKFSYALEKAYHVLGGIQLEILPNLETKIEGWYKGFQQLSSVNRSRLFAAEPAFIAETGRAYGGDLMLKYSVDKVYLYATYGWAMVQRTYHDDKNDKDVTYHPVFDRRHTVNLVADYRIGRVNDRRTNKNLDAKWQFSTRWTMGSGFPFTQTQGFFEKLNFVRNGAQTDVTTQNGDLGILLSGDYNGGRLPYYHRLDVSARRRFLIGAHSVLEVNLNVINLYNWSNIFYYDRVRNVRVNQLPAVPTLGLVFTY